MARGLKLEFVIAVPQVRSATASHKGANCMRGCTYKNKAVVDATVLVLLQSNKIEPKMSDVKKKH